MLNTLPKTELNELLEELYDRFNREEFIEHDPISIPHRFTSREDREVAGFLAATIAWGNRKAIVKSAQKMMDYLDNAPYDFVLNATDSDLQRLETYVHRTFNGGDFIDFIRSISTICSKHGGIGQYFENDYLRTNSIPQTFSNFRREFFESDHSSRCEKHLSSIDKGAACKRLNMYLRWMVRRDDRGVDFGLWDKIPTSALYLPLDIHTGNVGRSLGLLSRKQNDWKSVDQITAALREFDPNDPVKYDFALFGAGIEGVL